MLFKPSAYIGISTSRCEYQIERIYPDLEYRNQTNDMDPIAQIGSDDCQQPPGVPMYEQQQLLSTGD
jgi:hypothetical protein